MQQFLRRFNKDRYGAMLLVLLGIGVVIAGVDYHVGTMTRMGAGFLPVVYGTLITLVGIALGITSKSEPDEPGPPAEWRGWFCIIAGVFIFVLLGHYGGLIPATFGSVFVSAMGDRKNSVRDAALLGVAMMAASYLIFTLGLHLQLQPFVWGA